MPNAHVCMCTGSRDFTRMLESRCSPHEQFGQSKWCSDAAAVEVLQQGLCSIQMLHVHPLGFVTIAVLHACKHQLSL